MTSLLVMMDSLSEARRRKGTSFTRMRKCDKLEYFYTFNDIESWFQTIVILVTVHQKLLNLSMAVN